MAAYVPEPPGLQAGRCEHGFVTPKDHEVNQDGSVTVTEYSPAECCRCPEKQILGSYRIFPDTKELSVGGIVDVRPPDKQTDQTVPTWVQPCCSFPVPSDKWQGLMGRVNAMKPKAPMDVEHETTLALDKAKSLVCGDRARDYGRPSENHASTAALWCAYLRIPSEALDARDVCVMNMLQKMSRDRWSRIDDNPVDWAGYAQNAAWLGDPRNGKNLDEVTVPTVLLDDPT